MGTEHLVHDTACRQGFGTRSPTWLVELVKHLGGVVSDSTLFGLLTTLMELIIDAKELTPELMEAIYLTRQVSEEPTDDEEELVGEEFVLDCFAPDDKKALEGEIKQHKARQSRWLNYKKQFKTWKVVVYGGVDLGCWVAWATGLYRDDISCAVGALKLRVWRGGEEGWGGGGVWGVGGHTPAQTKRE